MSRIGSECLETVALSKGYSARCCTHASRCAVEIGRDYRDLSTCVCNVQFPRFLASIRPSTIATGFGACVSKNGRAENHFGENRSAFRENRVCLLRTERDPSHLKIICSRMSDYRDLSVINKYREDAEEIGFAKN